MTLKVTDNQYSRLSWRQWASCFIDVISNLLLTLSQHEMAICMLNTANVSLK